MEKIFDFVRNLWVNIFQQPVYSIDILWLVRKNAHNEVCRYDGLCEAIVGACYELGIPIENHYKIRKHLLDRDTARMLFGASDNAYWWEPGEWDQRKQYLDFLIKKFKHEKINWRLVWYGGIGEELHR